MSTLFVGTLRGGSVALVFALVCGGTSLRALAEDACIDFKWDVSKERSLFAGEPAPLSSGKDLKSAPTVVPNRLYKLELTAQDKVVFPVVPKKTAGAAAFAGIAMLKIGSAGTYRVALDMPAWVDVASGVTLIAASDFEGQHSCAAPHKIVEFVLTGMQPFVLQFSSAPSQSISFTVTPSPPRKL